MYIIVEIELNNIYIEKFACFFCQALSVWG